MRSRLAPLLVLTGLLVAACGSDEATTVEGEPDPTAAWSGEVLAGQPGGDSPVVLATDGDTMTVTFATDEGTLQGFAAEGDGPFEAGSPVDTGIQYLSLGGVARLGSDWVALGSGGLSDDEEELLFAVRAYRSSDGRTWGPVEATGLEGPADVSAVVAVDGGLVAVGALRTASDPGFGGFRPVAWRSSDGVAWTRVELPMGDAGEGSVAAAAVVGDEVLAVGSIGQRGGLWSSADGGATWSIEERPGLPDAASFNSVVAAGDTVVLSGTPVYRGEAAEAQGQDRLLLRSSDGGQTWAGAGGAPPAEGLEGDYGTEVTSGGGQFFTVVGSFVMGWDEPERCYADLERCQQDSEQVLYASADGDEWVRVDTSGIGEGEAGEVWEVGGPADGPLVALNGTPEGVGVSRWPSSVPLPTEAEPVEPTTEVVVLGEDDVMEPGVTYGVPLYIHCGMDWLFVGGESWERVDGGPDVETGAGDGYDPSWPIAQQTIFGFATLGADGRIEYSIGDGKVIATYARTGRQAPGCD